MRLLLTLYQILAGIVGVVGSALGLGFGPLMAMGFASQPGGSTYEPLLYLVGCVLWFVGSGILLGASLYFLFRLYDSRVAPRVAVVGSGLVTAAGLCFAVAFRETLVPPRFWEDVMLALAVLLIGVSSNIAAYAQCRL